MFGVDRCAIRVELDTEIDLLTLGIQRVFPNISPAIGRETQSYSFNNHKFINEIRLKKKLKTTSIKIDFNYPRYFRENNLVPANEAEKQIVDHEIFRLIEDISVRSIESKEFFYDYLEVCMQENVKSFYLYNNLVALIYKALCKEYKTNDKSQFANYSEKLDRFYSTGFQFLLAPGFKLRLYSKLHEHNPKTNKKEQGAILKTEYRMTRSVLKNLLVTDRVVDLNPLFIKSLLSPYLEKGILKLIKQELESNHNLLVKMLRGFNSRNLQSQIKDLQEWIYDYECIASVIMEVSVKSKRQTMRYLSKVKEALTESQKYSSPKRSNFGNLDRLKEFISVFLCSEKSFTHTQKNGFKWE